MPLQPLELSLDDVPAGLRLSSEAGWNQTAEDWAIFIRHGTVFGLQDPDGTLVATAAVLPYAAFGYVAMVLVTPVWRKRGLATGLVDAAIGSLRGRGLVPVLDATPAGASVYGRLGFKRIFDLCRWERITTSGSYRLQGFEPAGRPAGIHCLSVFARLDAGVFGSQRYFLLEDFLHRPHTRAFALGDRAFLLARQGHHATQLGPLVAETQSEAIRLLELSLAHLDGPMFLDVAEQWTDIAAWLESRGFCRQRPFQRMAFERTQPFGDPRRLMVATGPEFG
jgi:GNAT superfamily N-acetyltransferase